ncbi:ComC/BlpC family leader-containing pheromone/bacteriocin [Streptococcus anginosus]
MDKEQTLNHFHTLTDQELEQIVGGGWLEDLFSSYLKKYKLGKLGQPDLG